MFPDEPARQRPRGRPPTTVAAGHGRGRTPATSLLSRQQTQNQVPVTSPQDSRERHGYLEAIRQLSPENMTVMKKLGATLLAGLTGADAVGLISAGATLDPQHFFALRTILSRAVPLGQPTASLLFGAPKDWIRVRIIVQPNVLQSLLSCF